VVRLGRALPKSLWLLSSCSALYLDKFHPNSQSQFPEILCFVQMKDNTVLMSHSDIQRKKAR